LYRRTAAQSGIRAPVLIATQEVKFMLQVREGCLHAIQPHRTTVRYGKRAVFATKFLKVSRKLQKKS
jgi:hypothetical protein